jgi:hypothetical protein
VPWSPDDATRFKKDISPGSKDRWAAIANKVLQQSGDEGKAIRIANGSVRSALARRLKNNGQ